jgi:hypothetical protein
METTAAISLPTNLKLQFLQLQSHTQSIYIHCISLPFLQSCFNCIHLGIFRSMSSVNAATILPALSIHVELQLGPADSTLHRGYHLANREEKALLRDRTTQRSYSLPPIKLETEISKKHRQKGQIDRQNRGDGTLTITEPATASARKEDAPDEEDISPFQTTSATARRLAPPPTVPCSVSLRDKPYYLFPSCSIRLERPKSFTHDPTYVDST